MQLEERAELPLRATVAPGRALPVSPLNPQQVDFSIRHAMRMRRHSQFHAPIRAPSRSAVHPLDIYLCRDR